MTDSGGSPLLAHRHVDAAGVPSHRSWYATDTSGLSNPHANIHNQRKCFIKVAYLGMKWWTVILRKASEGTFVLG